MFKRLSAIYKDLKNSQAAGMHPKSLDNYIKGLNGPGFETMAQNLEYAVSLFYQEVAERYFKQK